MASTTTPLFAVFGAALFIVMGIFSIGGIPEWAGLMWWIFMIGWLGGMGAFTGSMIAMYTSTTLWR